MVGCRALGREGKACPVGAGEGSEERFGDEAVGLEVKRRDPHKQCGGRRRGARRKEGEEGSWVSGTEEYGASDRAREFRVGAKEDASERTLR